jgi:hypothetical protein
MAQPLLLSIPFLAFSCHNLLCPLQGSQAFAAWDNGFDVFLGNARSNPPRMHAGACACRCSGCGRYSCGASAVLHVWLLLCIDGYQPPSPTSPALCLPADAKLSGGRYWHYSLNQLGTEDVAAQVTHITCWWWWLFRIAQCRLHCIVYALCCQPCSWSGDPRLCVCLSADRAHPRHQDARAAAGGQHASWRWRGRQHGWGGGRRVGASSSTMTD